VGSIDFEEVLRDLRRRDAADSSRETAPLQAAPDAHMIDSTNTYIEDVIEQICDLARKAQM
jgi:cytidylate kinase